MHLKERLEEPENWRTLVTLLKQAIGFARKKTKSEISPDDRKEMAKVIEATNELRLELIGARERMRQSFKSLLATLLQLKVRRLALRPELPGYAEVLIQA